MKNYILAIITLVIIIVLPACNGTIVSPSGSSIKISAETEKPKTNNQNNNVSTSPDTSNSPIKDILPCQKALETGGQFSELEGYVDYKSGFRIFPLLDFIMTKHSIQAQDLQQSVFMKDNPIFVTSNKKYGHSLLFATIHSKRTGVLQGVVGFPNNEVTSYYEPMVFGSEQGFTPQVPATDIGPLNKSVEVNRETWGNELVSYSNSCNEALNLPPTKTEMPFFDYNGKVYPFSKEVDFVAGTEGIGFGLSEFGNYYYPDERKIQIPILFYCPECKIENVVMIQENVELKFDVNKYNSDWQDWLGKDWHMFTSQKIDFDENLFAKADLSNIHSGLPPFISDKPSIIQVTINGEKVNYVNQ